MSLAGRNRRLLTALPLGLTVYCTVSGGPFGLEAAPGASGIGVALLLILALPLIWALPAALMTAELASAIPEEGGYVVWVRRALGEPASFLCGWWTWLYAIVDAAAYPVLFAGNLAVLMQSWAGAEPNWLERYGIAMLVIVFLTGINVRGTRQVGAASSLLAVIIVLPFLAFAAIGFFRPDRPPLPAISLPTSTSVLTTGLSIVMWNYLGWDNLTTIAGEVERPEKTYPKVLLWAVPTTALIYFLPTWIGAAYVPDPAKWQEGAWPAIAQAVAGPQLAAIIGFASLASPAALFVGSLLGSSRLPFVLADRGYLPRTLVALHPKFGTPWRAILLCGVIYAALGGLFTFRDLVELNVILYDSALTLELISLVVLRIREPELARPFRIGGGWLGVMLVAVFPIALGIALVALSVYEEGWQAQIPTGIALLSGPVVYAFHRRSR